MHVGKANCMMFLSHDFVEELVLRMYPLNVEPMGSFGVLKEN